MEVRTRVSMGGMGGAGLKKKSRSESLYNFFLKGAGWSVTLNRVLTGGFARV